MHVEQEVECKEKIKHPTHFQNKKSCVNSRSVSTVQKCPTLSNHVCKINITSNSKYIIRGANIAWLYVNSFSAACRSGTTQHIAEDGADAAKPFPGSVYIWTSCLAVFPTCSATLLWTCQIPLWLYLQNSAPSDRLISKPENLNIVILASSSAGSCLSLSVSVSKPNIMADLTSIFYPFTFIFLNIILLQPTFFATCSNLLILHTLPCSGLLQLLYFYTL